jgi:hypothetical protein
MNPQEQMSESAKLLEQQWEVELVPALLSEQAWK